jgi:DNA-binding response OmpR family regulator
MLFLGSIPYSLPARRPGELIAEPGWHPHYGAAVGTSLVPTVCQTKIDYMRVLVVEDYPPLCKSISQGLREAGFAVDATGNGEEGLWYAKSNDYDVIILDLMLPGIDGLTILERLRSLGHSTHVLILTARDTVQDRVRGLDQGADDYLVKPFAHAELLSRVRALVRRKYDAKNPMIRVADLEIDTAARLVRRAGEQIPLTAREYALLEFLAHRAGKVVSRTDIWEHIYQFDESTVSNVVDVYVGYLRKKIERPDLPRLLHTRRGQGFLLGEAP